MFMYDSIFLVLTLFLILCCDTISSECNPISTCSCIVPESEANKFMLGELQQRPSNLKEYTLYIDPCIKLSESKNGIIECNATAEVSLCAKILLISKPISIGIAGEGKVILSPGYNKISVSNEDNTKKMDINCCTTCSTSFLPTSNSLDLHYVSRLVSPDLCNATLQTSSLSTGSVLVILLFVFGGLYFIGGAIILKCLRGATGWEMLPNHEFWCDLPSLVRDGIAFTFNCCRVDSYERI